MKFLDAHQNFLDYGGAKGYTAQTINCYSHDADKFNRFLEDQGFSTELEAIDSKIIRKYIVYLKKIGNAQETIRRKVNHLSSFYKYAIADDLMIVNPMDKVDRIKPTESLPRFLTQQEVVRLFNAVDLSTSPFLLRDKTLVRLLLYTGLRCSEICNLDWGSINFENDTLIVVLGKGQKDRIVPLNADLRNNLWNYLQSRLPLQNQAVFINKYKNRLQPHNLRRLLKSYAAKAGIDKNVVPHLLRHTCGTLLVANGVDLVTIKDLFGHESISTTQIYSHSNPTRMAEAVSKLIPKQQKEDHKEY